MELFREVQTRSFLETFTKITRDPFDAELMMMQLIAVGIGRYIAKLPELAGQDLEAISDKIGPKLDQYIE